MDSKDKLVTLEDLKAVHDEVARYTTCSTAASTAAKTAALTNFVLTTGSSVRVKFTNSNTAANPTLNVNSTGAKPIMRWGTTAVGIDPYNTWKAGAVITLVYDGTNWIMSDYLDDITDYTGGWLDNVDLDDIKKTGIYKIKGGSHLPTGYTAMDWGVLVVISPNYDIQEQIYFRSGHIYTREYREQTGWSAWDAEALMSQVVPKWGGTFSGDITVDKADGTSSTQGWSSVSIGNNKATGTAENSAGDLQIYGRTAYKTEFIPLPSSPTANRVITIPDESGTMMTNQGGTFNGNVKIESDNTATTQGYSNLTLGTNKAVGTAQNSRGQLYMYGNGTNYTIVRAPNASADRQIDFPDLTGTIAVDQTARFTFKNSNVLDDYDANYNETLGGRILYGIISNVMYISFDMLWIRLQFKVQNNNVYLRTIYGASTPSAWRSIG